MAKGNTPPIYKITIYAEGPVTLKGTVANMSPGKAITFHHKKPRSSKWAYRTIAWKDLVGYSGEQGKEGSVTFMSRKQVIRVVKGTINLDDKSDFAMITTEDNENLYVKPFYMDSIADDDVEAPSFEKKKKATTSEEPAKAKKKKAA